jgi:hypothetical protein
MSKTPAKVAARAAPKPVTAAAQKVAEAVAPETAAYIVGDCPVQHDGAPYLSGDVIALTAAQAARLGRRVTPAAADETNPLE